MCSYQEWERLSRGFREAVDEDQMREFVANAARRVEALVEWLKRAAADENPDCACGRGRRAPAEWV
ncbi:MAG TPA: hypothetical protein VFI54_14120 [Solirubrobacteraceae bacterium]|nr:hypothetical protein [Solirubrobacteraceae bacterium]